MRETTLQYGLERFPEYLTMYIPGLRHVVGLWSSRVFYFFSKEGHEENVGLRRKRGHSLSLVRLMRQVSFSRIVTWVSTALSVASKMTSSSINSQLIEP